MYTLDPSKVESTAASAPTPMAAPVYTNSTIQYPKLESTAVQTPMIAPMYVPSPYQYPGSQLTNAGTPAPMVAPVYMPSPYQHQPYQNPVTSNVQQDMSKIRDWLPWSIISLVLGGIIPGFIPLVFSLICRSKKKKNDAAGAKTMSTLALVFNIIMTIIGILSIIAIVGYLIYYRRMMENLEY
ncbi:unnamed protein product [Adineta steineri]|uniref:Uncharacterized protein n=1 Tax=Adineta steineri TaxID=433720 RepID=A0A814NSR5_9BILA|nr:unnamed protein product [Adineta steineri]